MQTEISRSTQETGVFLNILVPPALLTLCLFPWLAQNIGAAIIIFTVLVLVAIIYIRPATGVYLTTIFLPVHGCKLAILALWTTQATLGIATVKIAYPLDLNNSIGNFEYWLFYPFQLVALLTIPAFIFKREILKNNRQFFLTRTCDKWMLFLPAAFLVWALFSLLWVPHPAGSAYSLFRFSSNFVIMFFLISAIKNHKMVMRALTVYFIFAFIQALSALISTWHPFFYSSILAQQDLAIVQFLLGMRNTGVGYNLAMYTFSDGYGWSAKHELGMYLITAIIIAPLLIRHYRSLAARFLIICNVIFMSGSIYRGPTKVSILGSFLVIFAFSLLVPKLRKLFLLIILTTLLFNVAGFIGGDLQRVPIKSKMGMTTGNIEKVVTDSRYEAGTMTYRFALWQETWHRIVKSRGMGAGGDSLRRDQTFFSVHTCSLSLNIIHDYGALGFIFIFFFMLIPIKFTWRDIFHEKGTRNHIWWLQTCLLAALFTCLLDHSIDLFYWNPQIWFLLGLLWAVLRFKPQTLTSNNATTR